MKIKKTLTLLTTFIMAGTLSLSVLVGCNDHEHVYSYTVNKEATCMEEGSKVGVCGICGEKITEVLPIDENAHVYGDWEISYPTSKVTGKATKTCTLNASHSKAEVTLPVYPTEDGDNGDYTRVEQTTAPTALHEGENTYILANDLGDIIFTQKVDALGVGSAELALQAAIECKDQVRSVSGQKGYEFYSQSSSLPTATASRIANEMYDFNYTFGDNYIYIYDEGAGTGTEERWCSYDENGEYWAYKSVIDNDGVRKVLREEEEKYMNGNYLSVMYGGDHDGYGVEDFLQSYFNYGSNNDPNDDFIDMGIVKVGGVDTYEFRFGYVWNSLRYCYAIVHFTLTETYMIDTVDVEVTCYSNASQSGVTTWEYDETTGHGRITKATGERYVSKVILTQTAKQEGDVVITNPYDKNTVFVKSFDVTDNAGNVITESDVQTLNADTAVYYNVANIAPDTSNLTFDNIKIYYRTDDGDTLIDYSTLNTLGISASYTINSKKLTFNFRIAGEIKIVLKTEYVEKVLTFNVKAIAPSQLTSNIYKYSDKGYTWTSASTADLYVGQTLAFKANVPTSEQKYVDNTYTANVTSSNSSNATITTKEGSDELIFVATQAGTYEITMTATTGGAVVTLTVTVTNAPSVSSILSGSYTGKLQQPNRTDVTVTFKTGNLIEVKVGEQTETLSYTVSGTTLVTTHSGGVNSGFTLTINEAYKLVLSHPTGFDDDVESIVLTQSNS